MPRPPFIDATVLRMALVGYEQEKRYRCKIGRRNLIGLRRADYCVGSLQMASLSWRHHPLVRAVVLEVPDLVCPHGGDGAGAWPVHPSQLYLAVGADLRAGVG